MSFKYQVPLLIYLGHHQVSETPQILFRMIITRMMVAIVFQIMVKVWMYCTYFFVDMIITDQSSNTITQDTLTITRDI